jgi:hypothetical protein
MFPVEELNILLGGIDATHRAHQVLMHAPAQAAHDIFRPALSDRQAPYVVAQVIKQVEVLDDVTVYFVHDDYPYCAGCSN